MTDIYTKFVLTVIAASLAVIALRGSGAAIAESPTHVVIDSAASYALQYAGPMRVTCENCR